MPRTILWFRRDLRLADNPALDAAAAEGEVVGLFVVDPALWQPSGQPRRAFLTASLAALREATGGALVVRHGNPADVVPGLAAELGVGAVHAAADFGPYGTRRDAAVGARLVRDGRALLLTGSPYAVAPGTVHTTTGGPYAVFTPFARAWASLGWEEPSPAPAVTWSVARTDALPEAGAPGAALPAAGEPAAHHCLDDFLATGLDSYATVRNEPGIEGTSRLSPYLRWGALHPRQVLAHLGASRSHQTFRNEIAWREFYADVLYHHPSTGWENLQRRMDALPVDTGPAARERFAAWAGGITGYPIVDAGMRQLHATGWMHNRLRMITASFLVKDLHLPWQWGARHFMQHLVDGDLASNSHGWQWTAGTGTDAAPYFRVFNPVLQAKRFDADGAFVRRWLPELDGVADRHLHEPWTSPKGLPLGYPPPIVDHRAEREEALRRYQVVTAR